MKDKGPFQIASKQRSYKVTQTFEFDALSVSRLLDERFEQAIQDKYFTLK